MKLQLSSLFKTKQQQNPWNQWPSCKQPKTLSFRINGDNMFKTVNSIYFDPINNNDSVETPESWFTNSSDSAASYSTDSEDVFDGKSLEMVVRDARSERLFFEPGDTSSILEIKAKDLTVGDDHDQFNPFKESVVLAMESEDPYEDFKRSMIEMVESHGIKDWDCLEELLGWYLRVNGKNNHGFIVSAFVDLLVSLSGDNSNTSSASYSSAISTFTCSPICSSHDSHNEINEEENRVV